MCFYSYTLAFLWTPKNRHLCFFLLWFTQRFTYRAVLYCLNGQMQRRFLYSEMSYPHLYPFYDCLLCKCTYVPVSVFRYIRECTKLHILSGQIFLCSSNLTCLMRQHHSSHVDSKSNGFTEAVACCCTLLYWKMDALVWSTSFYWATTVCMIEDTCRRKTFLITKCSDKEDQLISVYKKWG